MRGSPVQVRPVAPKKVLNMKISAKGRYAVRIMTELVGHNDYVSVRDIAKSQGKSIKYIEQIVYILTKAKLLKSLRGNSGGYMLSVDPKVCTVADILTATKDMPEVVPCLKIQKKCPRMSSCETIGCWETLMKLVYDYLTKVTVQDLIDKTYIRKLEN